MSFTSVSHVHRACVHVPTPDPTPDLTPDPTPGPLRRQAHTYRLFERLHLDKEFCVTLAGTSIFQHVLNSITWVLLTRGKATGLGDIFSFLAFGLNGTALSGLSQFGKTFAMRFGFSWAWNWTTSQNISMPVFDSFLKDAD